MKIERILCPIDFSLYSKAANFYASLFADANDAEVIYLCVNYPPRNDGPVEDRLDDLYTKLNYEIRPFVHGVRHRFEVRDGNPAKEILKLAEEFHVDLVIMGTHGTTGLARLLHGSVCEKVLRSAKCPVMAVKDRLNINWILDEHAVSSHT